MSPTWGCLWKLHRSISWCRMLLLGYLWEPVCSNMWLLFYQSLYWFPISFCGQFKVLVQIATCCPVHTPKCVFPLTLMYHLNFSGGCWIQRMSSQISSQIRSRWKYGIGWLLPSRGKWGWQNGGRKKNPNSEALCMLYKLGFLWKGERGLGDMTDDLCIANVIN